MIYGRLERTLSGSDMNKKLLLGAFLYTLFVVYGSLVPLDFRPMPFDDALERFKHIRYLNLGIASRADWVANILLYMPLAYLWSGGLAERQQSASRYVIALSVLLLCWLLAVSVEFTQQFFPPRTVSINDLIAEAIGSTLGVSIWLFSGDYFRRLYRHLAFGNLLSINAAIILYVAVYLALSFFPFDFVVSRQEFDAKLAAGNHDLWLSVEKCQADGVRCIAKLGAEVVVLIPLGILICLLPYITHRRTLCLLAGFFIGSIVEAGQLFLASGVAQGVSVLTRMTGMGLGAVVYRFFAKHEKSAWIDWIKPVVLTVLPLHLWLVVALNGWTSNRWLNLSQALEKLTSIEFLPFYYFYYTTESQAMVSLLSNIAMYVPIGVAFWLFEFADSVRRRFHWAWVGFVAASMAVIVETGKLFLADKHPDPTDVLIAFAAAAFIYDFLDRALGWIQTGIEARAGERLIVDAVRDDTAQAEPVPSERSTETSQIDKRWRVVSIVLVSIIVWGVVDYPTGNLLLGAFLLAYGVLLAYYPAAWLIAVPALLPMMDFAPWTGRLYFDEFDFVLLMTLAAFFWRKSKTVNGRLFFGIDKFVLGLYALFYSLSLAKSLLPLQPVDVNSFSSYYSQYNGLRIAKGVLWAFVGLPLLKEAVSTTPKARLYFGYGLLLGLLGVIVVSVWERLLFTGLFNFEQDFRITAMFSTMHTGGGHIDAFLALSIPFVAMLFMKSGNRRLISLLLGIGMFIGSLYVLLVTYSRAPYLAFLVSLLVLFIALFSTLDFKSGASKRSWGIAFGVVSIIPLLGLPVIEGGLIKERFERIDQDLEARLAHWQTTLSMIDDDLSSWLFGMGVGSYPRVNFWTHRGLGMPATFSIQTDDNNRYLRLGSGGALYLDQAVSIEPDTDYSLSADLRSATGQASMTIPICEKSLLYSFRCVWETLRIDSEPGVWNSVEKQLNSRYVGSALGKTMGDWSRRPVKLGLVNNGNEVIEVDNIQLTDSQGRDLLQNGDFSGGTDFWFFTIDNHQALNIDNLWVHVLFDQGLFGVVLLSLIVLLVLYRLILKLKHHDWFAAVLLASLCGFWVVGLVGSPFDAPRLSLLFYWLTFVSLQRSDAVPSQFNRLSRH
ncbi:MAG: hypothetical protein Kow0065_22680 [Methylomicrobium sp.]